ncbi:MAG: hypothetical protein ABSB18_04610 [Candidatus Omnitrophota bacterium]
MPELNINVNKIILKRVNSTLFFCLIIILSVISFLIKESQADSPRTIPPRPCDFYGTEQSPNTIRTGSVITVKDPNGIVIGQFTVTTNGQYGFLTARADDPDTSEVEGAVNGDIITFYIDGVKQQKQAVWQSAETIRVDLGIPAVADTFNLHLLDMPGYSNYQGNPNFSGVAVADMIIDYLVPGNTDNQQTLMSFADLNGDGVVSSSELVRLLNQKVGGGYNFGSTAEINQYSNWGIIDQFNAANQADCIKQICHWLAYKVPNVAAGREYVPVAISTSANPAINADSDYSHWMSVVGIKTSQDPFPNLSGSASFREEYRAPASLQLYGVYLNDPGQNGLGFHTYMAADVWTTQYFRPIASGLEGAGTYSAIMEPPAPKAMPVKISQAKNNNGLQVVLGIPEKGVSVFIPRSLDKKVKDYLASLLKQLNQSSDFTTLIEDSYFGEALKDTQVNRCFKVSGKLNQDYTIVPFEKSLNNKLVTTLAVIVNNKTGQFQIASADNKASDIYNPLSWYEAYKALRKQIGWSEYPVKYWLSNSSGSPLFPGWSVVTTKYKQQGPVLVLNTNEYAITAEGKVSLEQSSPAVEILYTRIIRSGKEWVKMVSFKVSGAEKYTVEVDKKTQHGKVSILRNQDSWLAILKGQQDANCKIDVKSTYSTYIYIKK